MKPPRLITLIVLLYLMSAIVGVYGWIYLSGFGIWLGISLTLLFTAHLLSIPHNSGRIWCIFISASLFLYSAIKTIVFLGLTDEPAIATNSPFQILSFPIVSFLIGIMILMLSFHSSVCDYFDELDSSTNENKPIKMQNKSQ